MEDPQKPCPRNLPVKTGLTSGLLFDGSGKCLLAHLLVRVTLTNHRRLCLLPTDYAIRHTVATISTGVEVSCQEKGLVRHQYDLALEKMCNRKNVTYVSLRDLKFRDPLSEEGVHPLSSGHAMIAQRVPQVLNRLG